MEPSMAQDISDFIKESDEEFTRILFTGGEPLLNPEVIDIFAKNFPEVDIKIITNGTVLSERIKEIFEDNPNDFSIILSMDGPKEIQDEHRSNSFDELISNLDFFKKYIAKVNIVVTPESIFKLDKIIDFITNNVYYDYDILVQNGIDWEGKIDIEKFSSYFRNNCLGYTKLRNLLHLEKNGLCECGDHLMIDLNGDIYPCMNFNNKTNLLGNIYQGINKNKRRPYKFGREKDFGAEYVCLLKNRDENGSIFKGSKIHKFFLPILLDLVREVESDE
jgi:sulfatase maturation enzyme AslB (radical SAM superfamily)